MTKKVTAMFPCCRSIPVLLMMMVCVCFAAGQQPPLGTVLPVMLDTSVHSGMPSGASIHATVMQDVPLPDGGKIPLGSKLSGHMISASEKEVAVQFDSLKVKGRAISVATSLRALAGPLEIQEAEIPLNVAERGTTPWEGNTNQIGGEVAYRDAELMDGLQPVGKALSGGGALGALRASSKGCGADANVQSLWVFSTRACGVYGDLDLTVAHSGKDSPVGQIVFRSDKKVLLRSGSGLMLRVVSSQH